jgi:hypothetical protein
MTHAEIDDAIKLLRNLSSSGLVSGGILSINVGDEETFDLTAGTAVIVDNYTDPTSPVVTLVSWTNKTAQDAPYRETAVWETIGINAAGVFVFKPDDDFSDEERRDIASIGFVTHETNTVLTQAYTQPIWTGDEALRLEDFLTHFGAFNIEGNEYGPASTDLTVKKSAGQTFSSSINYAANRKSPNVLISGITDPIDIWYSFRDGGGGWDNTLDVVPTVDPDHWDDGSGVLQDVPEDKWTIQTISFYALYKSHDWQYGQAVYDFKEAALSALSEQIEINPYNEWDTFRGWLVVQQGATNLAVIAGEAVFRSAGKLGLISIASGGGVGGEVNTASNVGSFGVGIFKVKLGVDLQFKNLRSKTTALTVTDNPTDNTVDLELTEVGVPLWKIRKLISFRV